MKQNQTKTTEAKTIARHKRSIWPHKPGAGKHVNRQGFANTRGFGQK